MAIYRHIILECGGLSNAQDNQKINIFSPKTLSGDYPPNLECQWTILAPKSSTLNVSLAFMDLENCDLDFYDYIEIYQGFRTSLHLKTKTCKDTVKDFNITGDVTIRFLTDAIYQRPGFKIIVTHVQGIHPSVLFHPF